MRGIGQCGDWCIWQDQGLRGGGDDCRFRCFRGVWQGHWRVWKSRVGYGRRRLAASPLLFGGCGVLLKHQSSCRDDLGRIQGGAQRRHGHRCRCTWRGCGCIGLRRRRHAGNVGGLGSLLSRPLATLFVPRQVAPTRVGGLALVTLVEMAGVPGRWMEISDYTLDKSRSTSTLFSCAG